MAPLGTEHRRGTTNQAAKNPIGHAATNPTKAAWKGLAAGLSTAALAGDAIDCLIDLSNGLG